MIPNMMRRLGWLASIVVTAIAVVLPAKAQSCNGASASPPSTSATSGSLRIYAYNVSADTTSMTFPTWGDAGAQDDLVWYSGQNMGGGTWFADVDLANHKSGNPEYGNFTTHVYANGPAGSVLCAYTNWTRTAPPPPQPPTCSYIAPSAPSTSATSGSFRIYAYGVTNATSLRFPTWGEPGGQDDLFWYQASDGGGGTWYVDVNLANHKVNNPEYGTFYTHVYMDGPGGSSFCGGTSWTRVAPQLPSCTSVSAPTLTTAATSGGFRIYAHGVKDAYGVRFPTWGEPGGQDDLFWYQATDGGGGTWYVDVNLANHKPNNPEYGQFFTHVYLDGPVGTAFCGAVNWTRTEPVPTCTSAFAQSASTSATSGPFRLTAYGVTNAARVLFPTWGLTNGQNDLFWYEGTNAGNGTWFADVNLAQHLPNAPEIGYFYTDVYAQRADGSSAGSPCAHITWYRDPPPAPASQNISHPSGITVTLDAGRGGQVGSIVVPGLGETLVNGDGRGMQTSGLLFNESGGADGYGHELWTEGGCMGDGGNPYAVFERTATTLKGTAYKMMSWGSFANPCVSPMNPWNSRFTQFQISHTVSFPSQTLKVVAVKQTFTNYTGSSVTLSPANVGLNDWEWLAWPLAPQVHLARQHFVNPATNKGHWRLRNADGTWSDVTVRDAPSFLVPRYDTYRPGGHAIAVYRDAAHSSGVALFCGENDFGFYAKDMPDEGLMMVVNVWSFNGVPIPQGGAVSKTCHLAYGSEAEISAGLASAPLGSASQAASTNVALQSNGSVATSSTDYSGGFPASAAINGDRAGYNFGAASGWNDASYYVFPDWLQVKFNGFKTIDKLVLYTLQDNAYTPSEPTDTMTFNYYGIQDFYIDGWTGSGWQRLAAATANNLVKRTFTFPPTTVDRILITVTKALGYTHIVEAEAWGY